MHGAAVPSFPKVLTDANRMFCFDRASRYIARHSRLIAIRLRSRSFCSASSVAQCCTDMMGWSLSSNSIMRMGDQMISDDRRLAHR